MDSDSVGLSTPLPSPPSPSRSRVCMICGMSGNENHVYVVDVVIDESSLGDNHKIPPRVLATPFVDAPDIDLSAYLEMTPNIVLVDFPPIQACALDSVLYFFPQYPSTTTDVFSLELPRIGTSLNQHRVVYGEDGGMLNKAPNLLAPKHFPIAIRYGTRFLVFSTRIPIGLSGAGDHHFEIYHPCSEPEPPLNLKELPDLVILRGSSYDGFELYNIETKSSSEPFFSSSGRYEISLYINSYSLIEHIFVVRSNFGMFCLDLENPKVKGWERYRDGIMIMGTICSPPQVYVAQNHEMPNHEMAMEGINVYKDREDDLYNVLPRSLIPIPFNKHTRFYSHVMLLDSFKYPRCTPCIIQTQCESDAGCSYMVMDVVRIDLSKLGLEDEEWAEIIHSFKFSMKHKRGAKYYCHTMFPI